MGIFFSRAVQGYFLYLRTNANTPYCRPMVRWRAEGPISPFPFPASPLVSMTRWRFWGGIPQLCIEQFLDTDVFARSSSTVQCTWKENPPINSYIICFRCIKHIYKLNIFRSFGTQCWRKLLNLACGKQRNWQFYTYFCIFCNSCADK